MQRRELSLVVGRGGWGVGWRIEVNAYLSLISLQSAAVVLLQKIYFTHTHTQTHAWGSSALCGLCSSSEFAASRAVSAVAAEAAAQRNWLLNYCQLQLIIFLSFSDFLYIQTAGANAHVCAHMHMYTCMHACTCMRMYVWICMWLVSYDFTSHHTTYPSHHSVSASFNSECFIC